jgi:hypothetical protein
MGKKITVLFLLQLALLHIACAMQGGPTWNGFDVPPGPHYPPSKKYDYLPHKAEKPCEPVFKDSDDAYAMALKIGQAMVNGYNPSWGCDYYTYAEHWRPGTLREHIECLKRLEADPNRGGIHPEGTWGVALQALPRCKEEMEEARIKDDELERFRGHMQECFHGLCY